MKTIIVRGTGETLNRASMLAGIGQALAGSDEFIDLPYRAEYGPVPAPFGPSYLDSVFEGLGLLRRFADAGPFLLLGYSLGARIAGDFAAEGHRNLVATGLVADPSDPGVGGRFGVSGARPIWQPNIFRESDPADMICRCPKDSPIRTIADQTSRMSFATPQAWADDMTQRLIKGRWQKVVIPWQNPVATWGRYADAIDDVHGYLPPPVGRGDHTSYARRLAPSGKTYLQDLYEKMSRFAA